MLTDVMRVWRDDRFVRWGTLLLLASSTSTAVADPTPRITFDAIETGSTEQVALAARWPAVPRDNGLSLEDQITDHLTDLGNSLGHHLDLLSHDTFVLKVDGRKRRAHVRLGAGNTESLAMRVDEDIQFDDLNARCHTRIDLGFHGHSMHFELPAFDVTYADYRGDYGVELKLPLFERKF